MKVQNKKIPILSLFSGGGFLDLGFLNNGYQIEGACEINERFIIAYNYAVSGYIKSSDNQLFKNKIIQHVGISDSIDVSTKDTQKKIFNYFQGVTGIIGGPPCQDYSVGGKNKGIEGERGKLILSYYNIVAQIKPLFLLFENVEGLFKTRIHNINFIQMIEDLKKIGL